MPIIWSRVQWQFYNNVLPAWERPSRLTLITHGPNITHRYHYKDQKRFAFSCHGYLKYTPSYACRNMESNVCVQNQWYDMIWSFFQVLVPNPLPKSHHVQLAGWPCSPVLKAPLLGLHGLSTLLRGWVVCGSPRGVRWMLPVTNSHPTAPFSIQSNRVHTCFSNSPVTELRTCNLKCQKSVSGGKLEPWLNTLSNRV